MEKDTDISQESAGWKERLGFISGTAILATTALVKIWPHVATLQTGMNVHIWSAVFPGGEPKPGWQVFQLQTIILALGLASSDIHGPTWI